MKKKPRTIKAWAVFWEEKYAKEYGANPNEILSLGPIERFKVRCGCIEHRKKGKRTGWHFGDALAVFSSKREAVGWVDGNKEREAVGWVDGNKGWLIVPIQIIVH